jgi:hypothetical protein
MAALSPILDHVVIDVRDRIDEARCRFESLGFQLTPRGRHTLGSVNHLAMFATDYLELLGFAQDGSIRPEIMRFPIGLNGLVFKTADADLVHDLAAAAGLPILPVQSFSRPVALGSVTQDARFRTTRLDPAQVAMGRVYFCEHQPPPTRMAPGVADPFKRCLRNRPRGGRDRRSAAYGKPVPRSLRRQRPNGSQWSTNHRRSKCAGRARHPRSSAGRIRRRGGKSGRPHRIYGGSWDQGPVAARGGTMPALRPWIARRAAPAGRAGRCRVQYGYRILGVSDDQCGRWL